jgi:hypothetical protein
MYLSAIIVYVIMGALFVFVVVWAIRQGYVWNQVHRSGVLVEGHISEHRKVVATSGPWRGSDSYFVYFLTYTYEYQGMAFAREKRVSEETYLAYPDDTKIHVRCMSSKPLNAAAVDF